MQNIISPAAGELEKANASHISPAVPRPCP